MRHILAAYITGSAGQLCGHITLIRLSLLLNLRPCELKGETYDSGRLQSRSTRYRNPVPGKPLDLLKHFGPRERNWWSGGDVMIPPASFSR